MNQPITLTPTNFPVSVMVEEGTPWVGGHPMDAAELSELARAIDGDRMYTPDDGPHYAMAEWPDHACFDGKPMAFEATRTLYAAVVKARSLCTPAVVSLEVAALVEGRP